MPDPGGQTVSSSTMAEPWPGVRPYLEGGETRDGTVVQGAYPLANEIFQNGPPGYYPGSSLAGQSPYTQSAIGLQAERGLYGSPMVGAAQQGIGTMASGAQTQPFAGGAANAQGTINSVMGNPNLSGFQQQQGQLAGGLNSMAANNPLANPSGQAAGTYGSVMSGQGAFSNQPLQGAAQGTAYNALTGGFNPTAPGAGMAAGNLGMRGAGGTDGLAPGTQRQAGNTLQSLMSGNPFGNSAGTAAWGANALAGQNAASDILGSAQGAYGNIAANGGGIQSARNVAAGQNAMGQAAAGEMGISDPALVRSGQQGLMGFTSGQGVQGSGVPRGTAQGLLTDTLNGTFTGAGNPYFSGMVDAATRPMVERFNDTVIPGIASQFAGAGRFGSGAMADSMADAGRDLTRSVGDIGSQLAFNTYGQERGYQNAGIGQALQDYNTQQQMQLSGIGQAMSGGAQDIATRLGAAGQIQAGQQSGIGNQLAAASGIQGLRGQDIGALAQGAGLAGNLYGQGAGQQQNAAMGALGAGNAAGALENQANLGLLGSYQQGVGQQLGAMNSMIGAGDADRAASLNAANAATQGALGFGGQQLGATQLGLNNALNSGNQALTAAGLGQQGYFNATNDQLRASQMVPQLAQQDYIDINQLGAAGSQIDQYNQAGINADIDRWNYNANAPMNWTGNFMNMMNSAPWTSASSATQPGPSGFQSTMSNIGSVMQIAGPLIAAMMACWVAREAYDGSPKWLLMREFMLTKAPAGLRDWYLRHGEKLAAWLRANPEHKVGVREAMDGVLA